MLDVRAHAGAMPPPEGPFVIDRTTVSTRTMVEGKTIQVADIQAEMDEYPIGGAKAKIAGQRTTMATPLLRDGRAIGAILLRRAEVRPFSARQVDLLHTFADQAVIAIENVRLFNETKEGLDQQTATAEVLKVISRSTTDLQPVFDIVVEYAGRLCSADAVWMNQLEGDGQKRVAAFATDPGVLEHLAPGPIHEVRRDQIMGRAVLEREVIHVADILADETMGGTLRAFKIGARTVLGVPLLRDGQAIGSIALARFEIRPFSDREINLIKTFAAQAVIAIENVRLFNETNEALERQTATSEVLKSISESAFDLQPMFEKLLAKAAELCRADYGFLYQRGTGPDTLVASYNVPPHLIERNRAGLRWNPTGLNIVAPDEIPAEARVLLGARVLMVGSTVHVPDIQLDPDLSRNETYQELSVRAALGVLMKRGDEVHGMITMTTKAPGPFAQAAIRLVEAFADQAVIAIENVRLFNETKEGLARQTAISDILKVISSSPTNIQPVLEAVPDNSPRFTGAEDASVLIVRDELAEARAHFRPLDLPGSVPVDRGSVSGLAILESRLIHVADVTAHGPFPLSRALSEKNDGQRTLLAAPLIRHPH